jgi:sugar lactone lactonase YvrE
MTRNPLIGWRVDRDEITHVGLGLVRPECVLAGADGSLWTADGRGGVMRIAADGTQHHLMPAGLSMDMPASIGGGRVKRHLPNGVALMADGSFVIADIGMDSVQRLTPDGTLTPLLEAVDGAPLGKVNFALADRRGRVWVSVSTRTQGAADAALTPNSRDGYILLIDDRGARIVADGLRFTNEIKFDQDERWLYAVETAAWRISRFPVREDGMLGTRETFGPAALGAGFPDGIALDTHGNVWCAMVVSERLIAITPEGEVLTLLDDGKPDAVAAVEAAFQTGAIPGELILACAGTIAPLLTSVAFGGTDLRTVYLGSLMGSTLPTFRAPVAGVPPAHWSWAAAHAPVAAS